jgi:hypothetical protein
MGLFEQKTEGLHRGHRRTDSPVPSRGDKSPEKRPKYDQGNYHPARRAREVDREGNGPDMRAFEGD